MLNDTEQLQRSVTAKKETVLDDLRRLGRVAVALSGGVDSALLTLLAYRALQDNACAVTIDSPLLSSNERSDAVRLVQKIGIRHETIQMDELADHTVADNTPERCYYCKKMRFAKMEEWARAHDIPWLLDGSNADDLHDYRPGMKALKEMSSVRSPLLEAGFNKDEIRYLSRELGLFTWDKPAKACLASRIPYGEAVTKEKLHMIEQAEDFLAGILPANAQFRVRCHGALARLEVNVPEFLQLLTPEMRNDIYSKLRSYGFQYVTLDLEGYRMGSLNEGLSSTRTER